MSLHEYQAKRNFGVTAEPAGAEQASGSGSLFVVQKHDASRLHYDFRLEMDGVLKSWAVPKGFPTERGERRLAVHVEDHPLDYAKFEGIIPEGQYGGGTVMVWDFGKYDAGADPQKALAAGKLRCVLEGGKLKGEWTLVHSSRDADERNWFLIKTGDRVRPITKKAEEHSALTGRTLAQIAKQKEAVWNSNRGSAAELRAEKKLSKTPKVEPKPKARRGSAKPRWIDPMKATLVSDPPAGPGWVYELKWDGYRAIAIKDGSSVELVSRNKKPLTGDFPELRDAIAALPVERAVLDGEICALDAEGRPRFQLLQSRDMGRGRPPLFFYAFDLLHLEGEDLLQQPLLERKRALEELLRDAPERLRYSATISGDVPQLLEQVRARGLEGLIGKLGESPYRPGQRTREWVKLKVSTEQEFVIGGCTPPKGGRKYFGSLLVGYYEAGKLRFAGRVGTGFDEAWLKKLHGMFPERQIEACPFVDALGRGSGRWGQGLTAAELRRCTWVRPELVCQVRFAEWTEDGLLRHPVFLGLREDQPAIKVRRETPR